MAGAARRIDVLDDGEDRQREGLPLGQERKFVRRCEFPEIRRSKPLGTCTRASNISAARALR